MSKSAKAASREILAALARRCPANHGFSVNPGEPVPTTVPRSSSYRLAAIIVAALGVILTQR